MGYHCPDRVEDALAALAGGASVIAGGTDWYPALGDAPAPGDVLDITRLPGFRGITRAGAGGGDGDGAGWRIGAATTWTELARAGLPGCFAGLAAAAREVGGLQIQNAGTIGGNLCNASPAADGVPPLLTLDATVRLVSGVGARDLALADFITGPRRTALAPGELLESLYIPDPGAAGAGFVKLGARKYLVISIAMVAALVKVEGGAITAARVAVGACAPVACRLPALEAALAGRTAARLADAVLPDHLAPLAPISDVRGSAAYRLDVVPDLIRRALAQAMGRADG